MATAHLRGPKVYSVGGEVALWVHRFEALQRRWDAQLFDAVLALLHDSAIWAFNQQATETVDEFADASLDPAN